MIEINQRDQPSKSYQQQYQLYSASKDEIRVYYPNLNQKNFIAPIYVNKSEKLRHISFLSSFFQISARKKKQGNLSSAYW